MQERRKGFRRGLDTNVVIWPIGNKSSGEIEIAIVDLSKTGVGFLCEASLEIGSVYEGDMRIWTQEVLHVFIQITRSGSTRDMNTDKEDGLFEYGAFFVGMPEQDSRRIEVYDTVTRTVDELE
ncbi:MAG: hypothetical protein LBC96_01960 [Lachnospiraceae bacterium]|jgi:c-di-GMP-binding flagellar brake protein YcgR|nr:hypothetical protein [Lachnospiraceae bacterium]